MQALREAGRVGGEELPLLFRGLEALEAMVGAVRSSGESPPANPELAGALAGTAELAGALAGSEPAEGQKKKP